MKHLFKGVWAYLLLSFAVPGVLAQSANQVPDLPAPADVRVIVDISGSMKTNDPENLRQPAVRLIARLLPDGTSAGIWTFGQYVNMLVPFTEVDDAWRQRALERSSQINSVALRTNLGEALEVASESYLSGGDLSNTQFILLTDGKVDIAPDDNINETERQRVLGELLERIKTSGARIHTLALSEEADLDLLTALASRTGGSRSIADNASELSRVFVTALNTAVPQEQLPIRDSGFQVDSGVEEFTALIFSDSQQGGAESSGALTLVTPSGAKITRNSRPDNLRWVSETGYDLITVDQPQPGTWGLEGTLGDGSRITVVSDLRMVVGDIPARFYRGQIVAINTAFYEEQLQITNPDFLRVMDVSLMLTTDDGRSGRKVLAENDPPEDGVYRDVIRRLEQPGDYRIDLVASAPTFSRKFSGVIALRPPVQIVVNARGAPDNSQYGVTVTPEHPDLDIEASSIALTVTSPDGEVATSQLPYSPQSRHWQGAVTPEQGDGAYTLALRFTGSTLDGTDVSYTPESFQARFPRETGAQNVRVPLAPAPEASRALQASESSGPEPSREPANTRPQETPDTRAVSPEDEEIAAADSAEVATHADGPIDISQVEPPSEADEVVSDQVADVGISPLLLASAGGLAGLVVLAGGLFWWQKRRSGKQGVPLSDEAGAADDEPLPVVEDEGEPIPQLEPEVEGAIPTELEDDFGLEDFDLSDIDKLPDMDEQTPPDNDQTEQAARQPEK